MQDWKVLARAAVAALLGTVIWVFQAHPGNAQGWEPKRSSGSQWRATPQPSTPPASKRRESYRVVSRSILSLATFKITPFPYNGVNPSTGQPFMDAEEDGKRGHTTTRGKVLWETPTYSDKRVLLYIPKGFNPNLPAAAVVYFHGNGSKLDRDVRDRQQIPQQLAESGINAVLIAPQFAVDAADSSAGRFWEPGVFAQFMDEAADNLARLYGSKTATGMFRNLPIVLVAYSGGYYPAAYTAAVGGVSQQLVGLVLFDALYAEHGKFADFISKHKRGFFFSAYGASTKDGNESLQSILQTKGVSFDKDVPKQVGEGSVAFVAVGSDVEHHDMLTKAWTDKPLRHLLSRMSQFSRNPPRRQPDTRPLPSPARRT
jgi:hypothetical protein